MPQQRRYYQSNGVYEACIRVKEGLPFPALRLIKTILEGVLARVQRDNKITLCHYLWMGNHAHLLFVMRDADQCTNFFSELQKQATDVIKRLLGLSHLTLWEGEPSVMAILDVEKAKERIRYIYCNPARAHLIDTIDQYPGLSSWNAFITASPSVDSCVEREVPWIRPRTIQALPHRRLSEKQDIFITRKLRESAKRKHCIKIYPNAYLRAFQIVGETDIRHINEQIANDIKQHQLQYQRERACKKTKVLGVTKLTVAPIMAAHQPKKRSRRLYVLSSIPELRIDFIAQMKRITERCRELYQSLKKGISVVWPPGVFPPRAPILANALIT